MIKLVYFSINLLKGDMKSLGMLFSIRINVFLLFGSDDDILTCRFDRIK